MVCNWLGVHRLFGPVVQSWHEHLTLPSRLFVCDACEHTLDRDANAAINLRNIISSTGIDDCVDRVDQAATRRQRR
jgi:transposase